MEVHRTLIQDVPVLSITGKIDALTSGDLEAALKALVSSSGTRAVVDMGGVEYMSSSGLRALVGALNMARHNQGDLALASLQPMVREVFEITGIKTFFPIFQNVDEAVKSFKPRT